jgi:phosphohistidine phosphatase SixA
MSDRRDSVQLHLLRHAHAGDPNGWQGPDELRPLSAKGEEQAERLGRFLADVGFRPDAIVSSPKTRAARTAEIVAKALGMKIRLDDRLGGALDLVAIEAILFDLDEPLRPVFVGHDPDFSELAAGLTGSRTMTMRKGAFARIDAPRPLAAGSGVIRWLVPPDLLAGPKAR